MYHRFYTKRAAERYCGADWEVIKDNYKVKCYTVNPPKKKERGVQYYTMEAPVRMERGTIIEEIYRVRIFTYTRTFYTKKEAEAFFGADWEYITQHHTVTVRKVKNPFYFSGWEYNRIYEIQKKRNK